MSRTAIPVSADEGYERWAATYDLNPNPLLAREERHLLPLIANWEGSRALDLACGTGRWMAHLAEHGKRGVGVDRAAAMLRVARHKTTTAGPVIQGDCQQLPFSAGAFDLAICSFALGHITDLRPIATELARTLTHGSRLILSDLHPTAFALGWRVGFRDKEAAMEIEMILHSADAVRRTFENAGFECLSESSLWLEAPEKPFFERSGKTDYFDEASKTPAVIVCEFRLNGLPADSSSREGRS